MVLAALLVGQPLSAVMPLAQGALAGVLARKPSATATQAMSACQELLINGDLETGGGWQFGPTPAQAAVISAPVYGGAHALRLGIAAGNNTLSHSSAYQTATLPASAAQILLTYWERPGPTGDSGDYRELLALRPNLTVLRRLERKNGPGDDQWIQRTFDLTDLRGQSIVLYFNVYNNGAGETLVNYLDDITLQSCDSAATATPMASPTAPPVETPLNPTATATPEPGDIVVRAGMVTVVDGQTTVDAPLELLGVSDLTAVGVFSVDVQYDADALRAVSCPVSDRFDLILCNLAESGLVQLAGVAASGIHADAAIASLGFEILHSTELNTPLAVKIDSIADRDGVALAATAQSGRISIACSPGSDGCAPNSHLYLPLVQR